MNMKINFPQHPGIGNQTHFRFHSFYFVEKITARNFLFVSENCRQRNKQKNELENNDDDDDDPVNKLINKPGTIWFWPFTNNM